MMDAPVVVIGGYGPGLGQGLAEQFSSVGYQIVALSRQGREFDGALSLATELSDREQVVDAVNQILDAFGRIDVYVHNVASLHIAPFLETPAEQFEAVWQASFLSAVHMAQAVIPPMRAQNSGTIIFSGATAAIKGGKNFAAFSSSKFALRALSQSLAREFQPQGIHVAHVILDGLMNGTSSIDRFGGKKETSILPAEAASAFLSLVKQPRSAWSQEIDIRPFSEGF